MQAIWKKEIEVATTQYVLLPKGAEILCVQHQESPVTNLKVCIWFINPNLDVTDTEKRTILMVGTGQNYPILPKKYIGTVQLKHGTLVLHVFEQ